MTATRLDFGILLLLACEEFVTGLRTALAEDFPDQGTSDGYVLRCLGARPMTVSELATRLNMSKQGAGQIADDMERRGYVERRPDPQDGRARLLHLSARGEAALAAARRFHQRYERRLVREHGRDAVEALRAVLGGMIGVEQVADPRFRPMHL
ncbi:MarR family winged helix-turn-helix transcriptional regulator [Actinophytocola sp.]|uniref:MarR family winged helix-turn-helix transcriptional regulator n=1 Tax=Actinophytocola sp. TaxID=1872138 RepID=UPI002D807D59|nr:MarR family transcriptional regulator [Actinophytocola sp.]HET9144454.1 MarR family transcriptional regulator [Actinophytocola sp.]